MTAPTKTTDASVRHRVHRGAQWLDEVYPDWEDHVVLPELQMESACACVIGQVFGDYEYVVVGHERIRDLAPEDAPKLSREQAVEFGFDAASYIDEHGDPSIDLADYDRLQQEWAYVIAERQREA